MLDLLVKATVVFSGYGPLAYLSNFIKVEGSIYGNTESFGISSACSSLGLPVLRRRFEHLCQF